MGLRRLLLLAAHNRDILLLWIAAILPLFFIMTQQASLYDGIRHTLFIVPLLAVIAGWPYLLYIPLFIPMIGLGGLLAVKLSESLFDIPFPNSALGMLVSVIYQAVVFGLFLALLPR